MIIIILKLSDKNITNYNSLSRSTIYLIVHDSGNLQRYLYTYFMILSEILQYQIHTYSTYKVQVFLTSEVWEKINKSILYR